MTGLGTWLVSPLVSTTSVVQRATVVPTSLAAARAKFSDAATTEVIDAKLARQKVS